MKYNRLIIFLFAIMLATRASAGGPTIDTGPTCSELQFPNGGPFVAGNHPGGSQHGGSDVHGFLDLTFPGGTIPGDIPGGWEDVYEVAPGKTVQCFCPPPGSTVFPPGKGLQTNWQQQPDPNFVPPPGVGYDVNGCAWNQPKWVGYGWENDPDCKPVTADNVALYDCLCGNSTKDVGEECDDGNRTNGDGCSASCTLEKHSYQTYELKRNPIPTQIVSITDHFGPKNGVKLIRPERLFAPANVNSNDPSAPSSPNHGVAYRIAGGVGNPVKGVTLNGPYGLVKIDLKVAEFVVIPSAKSLVGPPVPLVNPQDVLVCYKAAKSAGFSITPPGAITVADQFGNYTLNLTRLIRWLCVPADLNGTSPGAVNHTEGVLCYHNSERRMTAHISPHITNVFETNATKEIIRREENCGAVTLTITP